MLSKPVILVLKLATSLPEIEADYIGVDAGALLLAKNHIRMKAAVGDFDSVQEEDKVLIRQYAKEMIELNPIKDESDSQEAIRIARKYGYLKIILVGGFGKRMDHQYVNEQLCMQNDDVVLMDEYNEMSTYKKGIYNLEKGRHTYISFFAVKDSVISLDGVKYPLSNYLLTKENLIGLSNEILNDSATLTVVQGKVLCIRSSD